MEMARLKSAGKTLLNKGLFHIMGTTVINNVMNFLSNILVIRFLTKADFGVFSFAMNIVSFISLFSGLGIASGLLQFASEEQDEAAKARFFNFSYRCGLICNLVMALFILLLALFCPLPLEASRRYLAMYALYPLLNLIFQLLSIVLRVRLKNRAYALLLNINSLLYSALSIAGAWRFAVTGLIIGRYMAYACSIVVGFYFVREDLPAIFRRYVLAKEEKRSLMKYSLLTAASNSVSQLLYLLDVQFIAVFIPSATVVASYKAATQIPTALCFIPASIMVFVYPYFAQHRLDHAWLRQKTRLVFLGLFGLNLVVAGLLFVFAPWIIRVFFTQRYEDSLAIFRILAINYFFNATFRIMAGNILLMLRKVKVNLYISIVSGVANAVLDIYLIRLWGSVGAAVATLIVVLISSLIACPYLYHYLRVDAPLDDV